MEVESHKTFLLPYEHVYDSATVQFLFIQVFLGKTVSELISLCYGFYNIPTPLSVMFPEIDAGLYYRGRHCD